MDDNSAIAGLREQIVANALILFPNFVSTFMDNQRRQSPSWSYIPPSEAFDVIVSSKGEMEYTSVRSHYVRGKYYQACLMYRDGNDGPPQIAAAGCGTTSMPAALEHLLLTTANGIGGQTIEYSSASTHAAKQTGMGYLHPSHLKAAIRAA